MTADEVFACLRCPKTFSERKRLTQHDKSHSKPHACKVCSRSFARRTDLERHIINIHRLGNTLFACNVNNCTYKAKRKDNLTKHHREVHDVKSKLQIGNLPVLHVIVDQEIVPQTTFSTPIQKDVTPPWALLMAAANRGDVVLLDYALSIVSDINYQAEDGNTALHCAASAGQAGIVRHLLETGASINCCNNLAKKRRPLHEAILGRQPAVITVLLQAGADFKTSDGVGASIASYIAVANDVDTTRAFLDGVPPSIVPDFAFSVLRSAIERRKHAIIRWLTLTYPIPVRAEKEVRRSLIYKAVVYGDEKALAMIIPLYEGHDQTSPKLVSTASLALYQAVRNDAVAKVQMLLQCQCIDVNQLVGRFEYINGSCFYSHTSLHLAVRSGCVELLGLLLNHKAIDIHSKDRRGYTAADWAMNMKKWHILRLIAMKTGFPGDHAQVASDEVGDPDPDEFWTVAKHLMDQGLLLSNGSVWDEIVQSWKKSDGTTFASLLIDQRGFNVNYRLGSEGESALHGAARHHRHDVFKLFLDHRDIDVNLRLLWHPCGDTVLHYAVRYDNMTAVRLLLDHPKIDLTKRDRDVRTPLELAISLGRNEMADVILSRMFHGPHVFELAPVLPPIGLAACNLPDVRYQQDTATYGTEKSALPFVEDAPQHER
ncbi:ankyrin repeat-containing domain protein [Paraphoma chrysanthemicola]|uniref:Ankyrin repeat-containing domain protein n=1 Tax=Paraphoma chrysanthemicola TaxID=798071 RepID=A0A8K0R5V3_9PLEO|nr:ankyrin repeat-containing domain protein [Paraphoma chrysanthemicola]